jgi:hypothetical protein
LGTVSGGYVWKKRDKGTYVGKQFPRDGKNCTQPPDRDPVCQRVYRIGDGFIEANEDGEVHALSVPVSH